ncbi:MAG: hypothetical protein WDO70_07780 [Alphaproteobacteria bacterium]
MITPTEITAALTSLKAAKDVAQAMVTLRDHEAFQSKLFEFQSKIIDAQNAVLAANDERTGLITHINDLEKQLADMQAWEIEKGKYELKNLTQGSNGQPSIFVYSYKERAEPPEPSHYICANCYQNRKKSILQTEPRNPGRCDVLICHECLGEMYLHGQWMPEHAGRKRKKGGSY